jgi:hypothetical protein
MAFLCVSQQAELKNTIKTFLGVVHVKNFLPKKLRKNTFFLSFFSLRFLFLIAFLAVSLHEKLKNTIKMFSKIRPENLKKSQKKVGRSVRRFFFSFSKVPLVFFLVIFQLYF